MIDLKNLKKDFKGNYIYPEGTEIKIKSKKEIKSRYSTRIVTPDMLELAGKVTVIERYYGTIEYPGYKIIGSDCYWDEGMFDVIEIPPIITVFIGKYDKNYIALVDGVFDEKIYSSVKEIEEIYKLHKIKLLFQDEQKKF